MKVKNTENEIEIEMRIKVVIPTRDWSSIPDFFIWILVK